MDTFLVYTSSLPGEKPAAGARSELDLAVSEDGVSWRAEPSRRRARLDIHDI
jgi:hypothetical protein